MSPLYVLLSGRVSELPPAGTRCLRTAVALSIADAEAPWECCVAHASGWVEGGCKAAIRRGVRWRGRRYRCSLGRSKPRVLVVWTEVVYLSLTAHIL